MNIFTRHSTEDIIGSFMEIGIFMERESKVWGKEFNKHLNTMKTHLQHEQLVFTFTQTF